MYSSPALYSQMNEHLACIDGGDCRQAALHRWETSQTPFVFLTVTCVSAHDLPVPATAWQLNPTLPILTPPSLTSQHPPILPSKPFQLAFAVSLDFIRISSCCSIRFVDRRRLRARPSETTDTSRQKQLTFQPNLCSRLFSGSSNRRLHNQYQQPRLRPSSKACRSIHSIRSTIHLVSSLALVQLAVTGPPTSPRLCVRGHHFPR